MVIRNEKIEADRVSYLVKLKSNKTSILNFYSNYADSFVLNIYKNKYDKNSQETAEQFIDKYAKFSYGDILEFSGKIVIPEKLGNPYEFDYKKYLNSNNIYGTITTYSVKKIDKIVGNVLLNFSYGIREDIGRKLYDKLPNIEAELFKSMVYGDDRALDEEIKRDFEISGISHLIAVSGSNVASVIAIVYYICNKLNLKNEYTAIITCIILVVFCVIASLELSILRASIMSICIIVFKLFGKKVSKYFGLFVSFLILFIYNPYCIFNVGFEFSYLATLSIIFSYSLIYSFFDVKLRKFFKISSLYLEKNEIKKFILKTLYNIFKLINTFFSITVSAQILTLPLQIYYFNSFALSSIISNIVIVALSSIQRVLGFLAFFTINIPYISDILVNANFVILRLIILATRHIVNLNLPIVNISTPDHFSLIAYYLIILLTQLEFKINRKINRYYRVISIILFRYKRKIIVGKNYIKKIILVLDIFLTIYIITSYVYRTYFESYIYYFNVGQGNMTFIRYNRNNIVIDMGSETEGLASNILANFLKAKAINTIDLVMLTHMHTDHINGLFDVVESVNIERVGYTFTKGNETSILNELKKTDKITKEKNISTIQLEEFDKIEMGNSIEIYILSPPNNLTVKASDKENANSLVILISIKNKKYIFTGDATKESEISFLSRIYEENNNEMLSEIKEKLQNVEVLQVGHHGSKTSTSDELLKKIKFEEGVISAQKKKYGHPDIVTLDILTRYNIKIRITENEGAIKYKLQ